MWLVVYIKLLITIGLTVYLIICQNELSCCNCSSWSRKYYVVVAPKGLQNKKRKLKRIKSTIKLVNCAKKTIRLNLYAQEQCFPLHQKEVYPLLSPLKISKISSLLCSAINVVNYNVFIVKKLIHVSATYLLLNISTQHTI